MKKRHETRDAGHGNAEGCFAMALAACAGFGCGMYVALAALLSFFFAALFLLRHVLGMWTE